MVNQTAGLVSDDQSDVWADDFMRTFNYLLWAVSRGQDQFLYRSGLSSAPFTVFQPNVYDIQQARAAGSQVVYTRQTFRRFVIRSVPSSMQSIVQRAGYVWSPYAIYLDAIGPVETDWIDARGNKTVKSQFQAGAPVFELVGGEPKHDPVLGDVWMMSFDFDCTATSSRQGLAPLCDQ